MSIKNKYLFLDIDGVMNTTADYGLRQLMCKDKDKMAEAVYASRKGYIIFSPSAVYNLKEIVRRTGCNIVISSTWRWCQDLEEMKNWFNVPEIRDAIIDWTPIVNDLKVKDSKGKMIHLHVPRGCEIYAWLNENETYNNYTCAVLDDDSDMYPMEKNWVLTDPEDGLCRAHREKCIELLGEIDD